MHRMLRMAARGAAAALAASGLTACVTATPASTPLASQQAAIAPAGFLDLCRRDASECVDDDPGARAPTLTPAFWATINAANGEVNHRMRARTDEEVYGQEEHWASAADPQDRGDCEDFALAKRRELVRAGVPKAALSIAVVFSARVGRHAVLVVATDRGDFVLDSLSPWVRPWREAGYIFLERQNPDWFTWASVSNASGRDAVGFECPLTMAQLRSVQPPTWAASTATAAVSRPAPGF